MRKCIKLINYVAIIFAGSTALYSQDLPIEAWRTHFSYNTIENIVYGNNKIFCTTQNGLFYVDLTAQSLNLFTKLDGLSDANPTAIAYSESKKALILGYESGLVDIVQEGKVTTISDIKNSALVGNKIINDITTYEGIAYLGTTYGVIVISIDSKELTENYRSIGIGSQDLEVTELLASNGNLYAITDKGVQFGSLGANLLDFNNWSIVENEDLAIRNLTATSAHPYMILNDTQVMSFQNDTLVEISIPNSDYIHDILWEEETLYLLKSGTIEKVDDSTLIGVSTFEKAPTIFTFSEGFWIGTLHDGLLSPSGSMLLPNGPLSDEITKIRFVNETLYAFFGSSVEDYQSDSDNLGFSYFNNYQWTQETLNEFNNLTDVAYYNGQLYFSSAGFGVYDYTNQTTLSGFPNQGSLIPEMVSSDNLYIPVFDSNQPLWSMGIDQELTAYDANYVGTSTPVSIEVSQGESLWIGKSASGGNGMSVINIGTDEYRLINSFDNLPTSTINKIAIDLSDEAWVATSGGVAVFNDATFAFENYPAEIPIYDNSVLFEGQNVAGVAVDGGNRIWMGTDEGLWIFDNSITQLDKHFTAENSPLPSNDILEMAYNPENGEMFILTSKGLVSYRSSSSQGTRQHSHVKIFPNPVRPDYDGLVGISGLAQNVSIKITDINGKLMKEVLANGGTASWDLLDYNEKKVASGIYIILSSSADGEETYIGKIAIVR